METCSRMSTLLLTGDNRNRVIRFMPLIEAFGRCCCPRRTGLQPWSGQPASRGAGTTLTIRVRRARACQCGQTVKTRQACGSLLRRSDGKAGIEREPR